MASGHGSRRWAVAAGSLLVGLFLAELACRLFLPAPQEIVIGYSPPIAPVVKPPEEIVQLAKRAGPGSVYLQTPTGRRLRPNAAAVIEEHNVSGLEVELRMNSLGHRNRELGPKQGRRILFLGDSITFADYLPEEETFVRQVETMARAQGLDWETVNAGVGSISLKTELAILLETGLRVEPDVVVLGWYLNDFQDSPGVFVRNPGPLARRSRLAYALGELLTPERPVGEAEVPWKEWWGEWVRDDLPGLVAGDAARTTFYTDVGTFFHDWGGAWSPRAWEEMTPLLVEIARVCRAAGATPVWLAFPARPQVEAGFDVAYPQERLARLASEQAVAVIDVLPLLRELHARGEGPLFYDQCHHTPPASREIARVVLESLRGL